MFAKNISPDLDKEMVPPVYSRSSSSRTPGVCHPLRGMCMAYVMVLLWVCEFTFDESPMFIPGTTLALVELMALLMMLLGLQPKAHGSSGSGAGKVLCAVCVLLCFSVFVRGCSRRKEESP
ncbi:hypothetical protein MLD38_033412 [Melastoma candidum]|uniref:Uncharacterized protein n=1 Tax=Melastoma candidum TaxID=119954 RepID=A0ACB9M8Y3_9MYRT|nr:hypothetical protein MLD38_033412 [Melastoma candidum]